MDSFGILGRVPVNDGLRARFTREITPRNLANASTVLDLCRILRAQCLLNREQLSVLKENLAPEYAAQLEQVLERWTSVYSGENEYGKVC